MNLSLRDLASVRRWKGAFVLSLFVAAAALWPSLDRFADGDDAYLFYDAGLRSWGEVLAMTVLPPQYAPITPIPYLGSGPIATQPVFVFGRWRPFSQFVYIKALWSLGLSPKGYRMLSWVMCWLTALAMAWGTVSALALAEESLPPETLWALATLLFWSVPTLFAATIPFFTVNVASLLFGLSAGVLCRGGRARGPKGWELAIAGGLAFLACQSHENSWWLLAWLAGLLGIFKFFGKLRPGAPRFWWPLALIAAHILLYRSLFPSAGPNWTGGGSENYSFAPAMLWTRFAYFLLAPLNGLADPLVSWIGADIFRLDVVAQAWPYAFLLTVGSMGWIVFASRRRDPVAASAVGAGAAAASPPTASRPPHPWVDWAFALCLVLGVLTVLPYCVVLNLRFMYYAKLLADLLAIGMILFWIRAPRPRALLLAPWLLANVLTTTYTASHISWLDWNAEDSRRYVNYMTQAFPPFSKCQPEHPCCLEGLQRIWGRNEWVLSYNLTQASQYPSFYPEGWPGARCERHYRLTIK